MFLVVDKQEKNKKVYRLIDDYQDLDINLMISKSNEEISYVYVLKKGEYYGGYHRAFWNRDIFK